jgi:hypothetical protein
MKFSKLFVAYLVISSLVICEITYSTTGGKTIAKKSSSRKTIGVTDTESITSTPFKAFSTVTTAGNRQSVTVIASASNTDAIYVLCLPKGTAAPTQANMVAYGFKISAGAQLIGGSAETSFYQDVWCVAGSGTQAVQFVEKSPANVSSVLMTPYAAFPNPATVTLANNGLPVGATYETFTTGATDIADTSSYTVFAAKGAGTHHFITSLTGTNSSTTDTVLYVEDGSTIVAAINCKAGAGFVWNPMPYFYQPTSNAGINVICRTSGAAIQVNGVGYWK